MSANAVRVLEGDGIPVRELPRLSGVSKEAIAMAIGFLAKRGYALVESNSSRIKVARLTTKGMNAQRAQTKHLQEIEQQWRGRFGNLTDSLTESIAPFVGGGMAANSPLFAGLEPPPNGWRTKVRRADTLPHFPMVLHRGGYPDGSFGFRMVPPDLMRGSCCYRVRHYMRNALAASSARCGKT